MSEKSGMKVLDLGPTGTIVASNVERFRTKLNLSYVALEKRLEEAGHRIPSLGLRRIEASARRVDVDELIALAVVLECTPRDLLHSRAGLAPHGTAIPEDVNAQEFRGWTRGTLESFSDSDRRSYWHDIASVVRQRIERLQASAHDLTTQIELAPEIASPLTRDRLEKMLADIEKLRESEAQAVELAQRFAQSDPYVVEPPWPYGEDLD